DADEADDAELVGAEGKLDVELAAAAGGEGRAVAFLEALVALEGGDARPLALGGDAGVDAEAVLAGGRRLEGRLRLDGAHAEDGDAGPLPIFGGLRFLGGDGGAELVGPGLVAEVVEAGRAAVAELDPLGQHRDVEPR